jgi:ubiquinone biosynthesis protein COQ4
MSTPHILRLIEAVICDFLENFAMEWMDGLGVNQPFGADIQPQMPAQMRQVFNAMFAMLTGDSSLQTVGELSDALVDMPAFDLAAKHLQRDPDCAALIRNRYIAPAHDLEQLLAYPQNSLGYIYAAAMKKSGFDPNLHAGMLAQTVAQYVELRLSQTHDIWHIVTGFDTSGIGEIGLQAFHLPQFPYPLATMLVANSLMSSTLFGAKELPLLLESIAKGWHMGKRAKPLFAQKWEEGWEKPLTQWQAELDIEPLRLP